MTGGPTPRGIGSAVSRSGPAHTALAGSERAALLTLVRHGQSQENAAGRGQGRCDAPLTSAGRRHMQALAERLVARGTCIAIHTGPLGRALESVRLLAPALGGVPVYSEPDLAEYGFGAWDSLTPAEMVARGFREAVSRDPTFAPPTGERFAGAVPRADARLPRRGHP